MKARRLINPAARCIEVEEFELPAPAENEILIENELSAVSVGTEIYGWLHGGEPGQTPQYPRKTGYCNAGVVLEMGAGVTDVKIGDRVAAQCSHASHSIASKHYLPAPAAVAVEDAVFLVMAAIALRGVRKGRIELGESVAVIGLGIVGQLALSLARLAGAMPAIAIDLDDERLGRAVKRGADIEINPSRVDDVAAAVRNETVADGADAVIEATGKPAVYPMAVSIARTAGRVVALGSPRGTVEMDFFRDVHLREVDLIGAIQPITPDEDNIYYPWTKRRDRQMLLQLMACGRLSVADLITHRVRPEQCQEIYELLADRPEEALGVVFDWRQRS